MIPFPMPWGDMTQLVQEQRYLGALILFLMALVVYLIRRNGAIVKRMDQARERQDQKEAERHATTVSLAHEAGETTGAVHERMKSVMGHLADLKNMVGELLRR